MNLKKYNLHPSLEESARNFGYRIEHTRLARRLTQHDLSKRADLPIEVIERIESGALDVEVGAILKVLWILGLDQSFDDIAVAQPSSMTREEFGIDNIVYPGRKQS